MFDRAPAKTDRATMTMMEKSGQWVNGPEQMSPTVAYVWFPLGTVTLEIQ